MNLLEHHILNIISEEDCTEEYARAIGREPTYPCVKVVAEVDCYGQATITTNYWFLSEWEKVKKQGYFMA